MGSNLSHPVTAISESGLLFLFTPPLLPGQKENDLKVFRCVKFAPLSSIGPVSSNKPFGFFFWSIFNCLVGKAALLLKSLIFFSSAVTWISPFSSPPPPLPTDPLQLGAFHPSPWYHVNNHRSFLLPAPSCSSLTFLNTKHLPRVFNTSRGLGRPRRRCWRRHAPSSSQLLLPTHLQMSWCWQEPALYSQPGLYS